MSKLSSIVGLDGKQLAMSQPPYEGATGSPRGDQHIVPSMGPNTTQALAGTTLRNRSRHGYRNSALLRSAINKGVTAEVGKGVVISSLVKDEGARNTLNTLWKQHQHQLDPWGDKSFGGILDMAVRARKMSGEVFIRRIPTPLSMGFKVPFQIEMLESDFCPMGFNKRLGNGSRVVQGIELVGRRKVAIYFHKRHPSEYDEGTTIRLDDLVRVPIRDVIHHYKVSRPGQLRGEPDTAAALLKDKEFADYSDAELNRKKTRSAFTGFLYRDSFEDEDMAFDPQTGLPLYEEGDAPPPPQTQETVQAGTILRGMAGEKLELFKGDDTGQGFKDFVKWQAQQLAAALDIPYPLLTGDWEGLSDRTIRAILNEQRRGVTADQNNLLGFQVCLKVWQWMVNCCILNGLISAPGFADDPWAYYALDLRFDAWRHLHPEQDIRSRTMATAAMLSNPEKEAADCGTDLEDNMRATARSMKKWEDICKQEGIDPSKVNAFNLVNNEATEEKDAE
ncbi:portal protein [Aeromonas phage 14AhydR10PP]|nr:portal protein [Aeromonas phage 14AhydR10PP]